MRCVPTVFIYLLQIPFEKTAHPFRPSGRKGIAKRHETLKNQKEYAYNRRTLRRALSLNFGDFFLQPHHSLRYHHIEAQK